MPIRVAADAGAGRHVLITETNYGERGSLAPASEPPQPRTLLARDVTGTGAFEDGVFFRSGFPNTDFPDTVGIQPLEKAYGRPRRPLFLPPDRPTLRAIAAAVRAPAADAEPVPFYPVERDDDPGAAIGVAVDPADPARVLLLAFDRDQLGLRVLSHERSRTLMALELVEPGALPSAETPRGAPRGRREADGTLRLDWHGRDESLSIRLDRADERLLEALTSGVARHHRDGIAVCADRIVVAMVERGDDPEDDLACLVRNGESLMAVTRSELIAALDERDPFAWRLTGPRKHPRRDYRLLVRLYPPDGECTVREVDDGWVASFADPDLTAWGATREAALLMAQERLALLVSESLRAGHPLPTEMRRYAHVEFEITR